MCVGSMCVSVICGYLALLVYVQFLPQLHGKSLQQGGAHMLTQIQAQRSIPADGGFQAVVFFLFFFYFGD